MAQTPAIRDTSEGDNLYHTALAAITAGDVILVGSIPLIATQDIASGDTGALAAKGTFKVPKITGAITLGAPVYWDADGSPVTGTASSGAATIVPAGNTLLGTCVGVAAASGDTYVIVDLIGTKGISAVLQGPTTNTPGASTVAAGTTTADAGVLPAATASVYPTTAADDTKGVRVNAADKVTGRQLYIGNGVANKILNVYAPSGGTINGAAADAAFLSASGAGVWIVCLDATANTWLAA